MSQVALMAWAIAAITAVAMSRVVLSSRGDHAWRRAVLLVGQFALAALLWCVLVPPSQPGQGGALVLLTEGADLQALAPAPGDRVLSLPGAPAFEGADSVPDLGTALRRHPDARPVRVLGRGLAARDRDAAGGVGFEFVPAPLPETLVALSLPDTILRGRRFELSGVITGHDGGEVELLDPAGERIDRAALGEAGAFAALLLSFIGLWRGVRGAWLASRPKQRANPVRGSGQSGVGCGLSQHWWRLESGCLRGGNRSAPR